MELVFRENAALPSLSWAAEIGGGRVLVHHGPRLDRGRDWCADGCWPGPFEAGPPVRKVDAHFAFTLRMVGEEVRIDCPTHPLERLHLLREKGRIFASPSIPFLFALANASADPAYPYYDFDFINLMSRISSNVAPVPLAGGKSLEVIANRRVTITSDLEVAVEYRPLEKVFGSFEEYVDFLAKTLEAMRENAQSKARQSHFGLLSTISNGYDASAMNALGVPLGWKEAITFSAPGDTHDSGEEIGVRMGMKVHPIERHAYLRMSNLPEVEFLATGTRGEDVVFAGAERFLRNKVFMTGTHGDKVWDRITRGMPTADIQRVGGSGAGLTEFRWRLGFIHIPGPHIGAMGIMSLKVISNSREMAPWAVGGSYDRPIPRRILESRGIPRGTFASVKHGMVSVSFGVADHVLKKIMSLPSFESLQEFCRRNRKERPMFEQLGRLAKYAAHRTERFLGHRIHRAGWIDHIPQFFDPRHQIYPGMASYLFQWSTGIMKDRYNTALTGRPAAVNGQAHALDKHAVGKG